MKAIKFIVAVALLFGSCSKKEISPNNTNLPDNNPQPIDTLTTGWSKVVIPAAHLTDIVFIDNNTGFVISDKGLYRSVDGGNNWQLTSARVANSGFLTATPDGKVFVIKEDVDSLFCSFDGGTNFSAIKFKPSSQLTDVFFLNNDTGYAPAGKNELYRTTDGGHTWQAVALVTGLDLSSGDFLPFFVNGNTGWISDGRSVFYTKGSINVWERGTSFPVQNSSNAVPLFAIDANVVYAAAKTVATSVYKSTDGGAHFLLAGRANVTEMGYPDLHFIDESTGYLCNFNKILITSNGGSTWRSVVSLAHTQISEIHFTDSDHGWACCLDGTVLIFKR